MATETIHGVERLETPERVDLTVELAGVGPRALAFLVDFLLLLVGAAIILVVLLSTAAHGLGRTALIVGYLSVFTLWWFYFAAFEIAWEGQTPGKRMLGLRVLKEGGYPIGWPEALIRNFLRMLVDLGLVGAPIGLVVMVFDPKSRRIGDLAAGTVVVRERTGGIATLATMGFVDPAAGDATRPAPVDLTTDEFELLHEFLARASWIEPASRDRLRGSIAGLIRERLSGRGAMRAAWRDLGDAEFLLHVDAAFRGEDVAGTPEGGA